MVKCLPFKTRWEATTGLKAVIELDLTYEEHLLEGLAPLVTNPSWWNYTTRQNPRICNPSLYIAISFKNNHGILKALLIPF